MTAGREAIASCRDVEVVYGDGESAVRALDDVSVEIGRHDSLALLGRSGSGKTTLLHVLGGLAEATAGDVEWRGRPLASLDRAARGAVRAHGIAYVFQGANLLPHFTAYENIAFAAELAGAAEDRKLTPEALLQLVGLTAKADHLPAELSGGEAQRVAIARALAPDPTLLLLDEPTSALDPARRGSLGEVLRTLAAEGHALLISTHDVDFAEAFADRVAVLAKGVVVEVGSPREVLSNSTHADTRALLRSPGAEPPK